MSFSTFFIDLDETVYPTSAGVWDAISARMEQYMHERLHFKREEIPSLRRALYLEYGTTLRGLMATCQVNERDFIDYVHDLPLDRLLTPNHKLRELLTAYPQRKIILTNADRGHARRVMERLQIGGCFESIVDIYDLMPYCKPLPEAFQTALRLTGEACAEQCVFIDDSPSNLAGARALGFFTIRVGSAEPIPQAHASILTLADLPTVIPLPAASEFPHAGANIPETSQP